MPLGCSPSLPTHESVSSRCREPLSARVAHCVLRGVSQPCAPLCFSCFLRAGTLGRRVFRLCPGSRRPKSPTYTSMSRCLAYDHNADRTRFASLVTPTIRFMSSSNSRSRTESGHAVTTVSVSLRATRRSFFFFFSPYKLHALHDQQAALGHAAPLPSGFLKTAPRIR